MKCKTKGCAAAVFTLSYHDTVRTRREDGVVTAYDRITKYKCYNGHRFDKKSVEKAELPPKPQKHNPPKEKVADTRYAWEKRAPQEWKRRPLTIPSEMTNHDRHTLRQAQRELARKQAAKK